jgi:lantibiotic biosynthesis protein
MIDTNYIVKNTTRELAKEKILLINNILGKNAHIHHGFLGGSLGLLYYYYHAGKVLQNNAFTINAENLLAKVFEDINNTGKGMVGPLFGNGAAGFAYTVNYLQENEFIDFDIENEFTDLEKYLFNAAKELLATNDIDYLHGATGIFHYFTTRAGASYQIHKYLNILAEDICNKAIKDKDGIWFKNYSLERLKENNTVDFGLAHGLSGILLILIKAWPFLNNKEPAEQIIKSGIEYILAHQFPADDDETQEYSLFPTTLNNETNELMRINRLAWCYGDLNEVLLLYRAGKLFLNKYYTDKADEIGFQAIERKSEEATLCNDSHFCHGSAGLAQFYKCLYKESGQHKYYQTYEYWINNTLDNIDKDIAKNAYTQNPIGLLEGWSGIALVLTEYIHNGEGLNWAKAFLL